MELMWEGDYATMLDSPASGEPAKSGNALGTSTEPQAQATSRVRATPTPHCKKRARDTCAPADTSSDGLGTSTSVEDELVAAFEQQAFQVYLSSQGGNGRSLRAAAAAFEVLISRSLAARSRFLCACRKSASSVARC